MSSQRDLLLAGKQWNKIFPYSLESIDSRMSSFSEESEVSKSNENLRTEVHHLKSSPD